MRTQSLAAAGKTQAMPAADPAKTAAMAAAKALEVRVLASREATMANGPAREQFLVEIAAAGLSDAPPGISAPAARTPLNLCLVIDRSGSMEGAPLEYVKRACNYVIDLLTPQDVLSIVTFEEAAEVLMAPQRVTDKQPIRDGIARLYVGNTTNLFDGLGLGAQQVLGMVEAAGRATRVIVFSDGEPTAGVTEFASLVNQAGDVKARGVTITFLGFGADYNEELLAAMAKRAGGNYYYIPNPELIPEVFRTELEKLMTVVARNLRLELKLARWASLRGATGLSVAPTAREVELPLADLERGALLQQMVDLEFPNHPLGWYRVAEGTLTYDDLLSGRTEAVDLDLVMEFTADAARYSVAPNPAVTQAAELAAASRAVERTMMGLKTGQMSAAGAAAELQKTQALLLKDGRVAEAQEVTMALRALQSGDAGGAQKTLMGTILNLDQGKKPG